MVERELEIFLRDKTLLDLFQSILSSCHRSSILFTQTINPKTPDVLGLHVQTEEPITQRISPSQYSSLPYHLPLISESF